MVRVAAQTITGMGFLRFVAASLERACRLGCPPMEHGTRKVMLAPAKTLGAFVRFRCTPSHPQGCCGSAVVSAVWHTKHVVCAVRALGCCALHSLGYTTFHRRLWCTVRIHSGAAACSTTTANTFVWILAAWETRNSLSIRPPHCTR